MRIGVLGGTFDPPHNGHLALAEAAIEALSLDEVVFLPAFRNPLKTGRRSTAADKRLEMVRLLIDDRPNLAVSDADLTRRGPSYALHAMMEFHMARPAEYWFLVGADALHDLPQWKQPSQLLKLCRIGAVSRGGKDAAVVTGRLPDDLRPFVDLVPMKPLNVSASELRDQVARNLPTNLWMPDAVRRYIEANHLYRN
jgi:nicotinate-nucleotide adenylyltransferase